MAHTNNWMSSLSQQFWSTPMYPSAWSETEHKYSSIEREPSIEKNTNTKGDKKCIRLGIYDYAHCGGTGICSRCDGNKKYFSNAYGISRWYEVSVSAMLVYTRQKNIAQVFILERYFFVSIYPAAIPGTYLAMFLVAVLQLC